MVVSSYYPPLVGGASTVVSRLLSAFRSDAYAVVSEAPGAFDGRHNATLPPGVLVARIGVPPWCARLPYGVRLARRLRYALIPAISRLIERVVRQSGAERLVALYPSWPFLVAAYRVHRRTGIPLLPYYMDVTVPHASARTLDQWALRRYEPALLQRAYRRMALSDAVADDWRARYGLASDVIRHTVDVRTEEAVGSEAADAGLAGTPRLCVHTGVVEGLQLASLKRLARAVDDAPDLHLRVVLSTPTPRAALVRQGLDAPCLDVQTLDDAAVRALQRRAALAVAVLPFEGEYAAIGRTAFPTKIVEYLVCGAPILLHAPADSFAAREARRHGYAWVVDEPSERALSDALRRLLTDSALRHQLVDHAARAARELYALPVVARRFAEACGVDPVCLV